MFFTLMMNNHSRKYLETVSAYRPITIKCVFRSTNSNNVISCQIMFYFSFLERGATYNYLIILYSRIDQQQ
ncbi:unnamed protein product [Rotaria magnacalcarata]